LALTAHNLGKAGASHSLHARTGPRQAALDSAKEALREYRREANFDGEWARDVEDATVGILPDGVALQQSGLENFLGYQPLPSA
jgi:hypothetical protein